MLNILGARRGDLRGQGICAELAGAWDTFGRIGRAGIDREAIVSYKHIFYSNRRMTRMVVFRFEVGSWEGRWKRNKRLFEYIFYLLIVRLVGRKRGRGHDGGMLEGL